MSQIHRLRRKALSNGSPRGTAVVDGNGSVARRLPEQIDDAVERQLQQRTAALVKRIDALQAELAERTRSEETLRREKTELERMNRLMMDREQRILGLKGEVNSLLTELGKSPRYQISP